MFPRSVLLFLFAFSSACVENKNTCNMDENASGQGCSNFKTIGIWANCSHKRVLNVRNYNTGPSNYSISGILLTSSEYYKFGSCQPSLLVTCSIPSRVIGRRRSFVLAVKFRPLGSEKSLFFKYDLSTIYTMEDHGQVEFSFDCFVLVYPGTVYNITLHDLHGNGAISDPVAMTTIASRCYRPVGYNIDSNVEFGVVAQRSTTSCRLDLYVKSNPDNRPARLQVGQQWTRLPYTCPMNNAFQFKLDRSGDLAIKFYIGNNKETPTKHICVDATSCTHHNGRCHLNNNHNIEKNLIKSNHYNDSLNNSLNNHNFNNHSLNSEQNTDKNLNNNNLNNNISNNHNGFNNDYNKRNNSNNGHNVDNDLINNNIDNFNNNISSNNNDSDNHAYSSYEKLGQSEVGQSEVGQTEVGRTEVGQTEELVHNELGQSVEFGRPGETDIAMATVVTVVSLATLTLALTLAGFVAANRRRRRKERRSSSGSDGTKVGSGGTSNGGSVSSGTKIQSGSSSCSSDSNELKLSYYATTTDSAEFDESCKQVTTCCSDEPACEIRNIAANCSNATACELARSGQNSVAVNCANATACELVGSGTLENSTEVVSIISDSNVEAMMFLMEMNREFEESLPIELNHKRTRKIF